MSKNIWLRTEERPKKAVIQAILKRFCAEFGVEYVGDIKILPVISPEGRFQFRYKVIGFEAELVKEIFILPVSGYSSFVDFMLFYQDEQPTDKDKPLLLIEETKTDDVESRNTGVYKRCSKFVFTEFFYPNVQKIMLYNRQIPQKVKPTLTYIFGTRMLLTLDVEIIGKSLDPEIFRPFSRLDELIDLKNSMPKPYNGVPVRIKKEQDKIYISAKLEKAGRLAHDPNIGMVAIMAACIRKLGWSGEIIITKHGLADQSVVGNKNKFNFIAHEHEIELEGITLPNVTLPDKYWKVEKEKEKAGTIFVHVICENLVDGVSIYENHGGSERGYFWDHSTIPPMYEAVKKYTNREEYKSGNKEAIVYIPDLVLLDVKRNEIINIEGKTYKNRLKGVQELSNYVYFELNYIQHYYKDSKLAVGLVLAGSGNAEVAKQIPELILYLDDKGNITLGDRAPQLVKDA